jgi:hypothetical protein
VWGLYRFKSAIEESEVSGEKGTWTSFSSRAIFLKWEHGGNQDPRNPCKENADGSFRDEKAGRVVVFSGDRRTGGYVVRSETEELKIKSFLKMFYFAHFSILLLGYFLASEWSRGIYRALGRPEEHLFRAMCISLGVYLAVVAVPYFLLWRSYKKALMSFVSLEDEVLVSGRRVGRQQMFIFIAAGLMLLGLAVLLAFAVSHKP